MHKGWQREQSKGKWCIPGIWWVRKVWPEKINFENAAVAEEMRIGTTTGSGMSTSNTSRAKNNSGDRSIENCGYTCSRSAGEKKNSFLYTESKSSCHYTSNCRAGGSNGSFQSCWSAKTNSENTGDHLRIDFVLRNIAGSTGNIKKNICDSLSLPSFL